ncbi:MULTISPECIES: DUF2332 domain-containing protein [Mycobacteriaceae]|uniref:DUF2332 domain-containing protein n=2 Tax=Mycobacteriaceae TaxID=1762 RepID=A0A1Q9WG25_9MYCO|nr:MULTISPECIES: DUF2332 domain-containing protein [Mycobacteriaceae]MBP2451854.1 hypothetical protein [Mycolicibacterium lutetiense]OHT92475.1 hypothetical protein BKG61_24310 [Mycobacterium syngnathidarum]OLT97746.1 hypothetical protein BKG60_05120 [Mycobacterium syngnathidarum]
MDEHTQIGRRYRQFAKQQAHGSSPTLEAWAHVVADDPILQGRLATLPSYKQQPNLVFAALRWHGATPGDETSLRHGLLEIWRDVEQTILLRSTQTNEAARCAILLPLLHHIGGPIALIELGASAGLCMIPDLYSYHYSDGTVVVPSAGRSDLLIECDVTAGHLPPTLTPPQIEWRAGIDLNPLDPADSDTRAWLTALTWPEHEQRRQRLETALRLAAQADVRITRGDVRDSAQIEALVAEAPSGTTPVVVHSATLGYLSPDDRAATVEAIKRTRARWISFEGRGIVETTRTIVEPLTPTTLFVGSLDQVPLVLADGHGHTMASLDDHRDSMRAAQTGKGAAL